MKITISITIEEDDARHLEDFVNWVRTDHIREVVPSRDSEKAYEIRQAAIKISSAIKDAAREGAA